MKYFILKKIMKSEYTGYTKNQASRLIFFLILLCLFTDYNSVKK